MSGLSSRCLFDVGLAEDGQRRALLGVEQAFHGGQRDRLVEGDVLALPVAGGKEHQDAGDGAGDHAQAHESAAVLLVALGSR